MEGMPGEEPVAITHLRAEIFFSPVSTVCSSVNSGLPNSTPAPREQKRSTESCCCISAITCLILAETA